MTKTTQAGYCACGMEVYDASAPICPSCGQAIALQEQRWHPCDATSISELLRRYGYVDPWEPVYVDAGGDWGIREVGRSDLCCLQRTYGNGELQTLSMRHHRGLARAVVIPRGKYTSAPSNMALGKSGRAVCVHAARVTIDEIRAGRGGGPDDRRRNPDGDPVPPAPTLTAE